METARQPPNPLAVTAYAFPGVMALLYLTGVATAVRFTSLTSETWTIVWASLMLAGSALGVAALFAPRRRLLIALNMESTAAALLGVQIALYALSLLDTGGRSVPWYTLVVSVMLSVGLLVRAGQAQWERWRLIRLVRVVQQGDEL